MADYTTPVSLQIALEHSFVRKSASRRAAYFVGAEKRRLGFSSFSAAG